MGTASRPRKGSLQFWPRKRAAKPLPSANWSPVSASTKEKGLLGIVAYKAGMGTALVKDVTDKSPTLNKQIAIPVTILEVPAMKIFSVRFYKDNQVISETTVSNDKELKRRLKVPRELKNLDNPPESYDDIRLLIYSLPKQTAIKKSPDLIEVALNAEDKLSFVKDLIRKELSIENFAKSSLVDVRGLTRGKGLIGPIKRYGLRLKFHKSEKGRRRPGSLAPWHPARVTFHAPLAGQGGYFTRLVYNLKIITFGKISEKDVNPKAGFKQYGKIKSSYIILKGSVPGPQKRQVLLTPAIRPSKIQKKKKYGLVEVYT